MDHFLIEPFWFNRFFLAMLAALIAEQRGYSKVAAFMGVMILPTFLSWFRVDLGIDGDFLYMNYIQRRIFFGVSVVAISWIKGYRKWWHIPVWAFVGVFHIFAFIVVVAVPLREIKKKERPS